jgi:hypothetical protein
MLESLTSAGYDLDLLQDLYRILFTGWTESEVRFALVFFLIMTAPIARRLW